MTILYVNKTIMTCSRCSHDYIFPEHLTCPNCGDAIVFEGVDTQQNLGAPPPNAPAPAAAQPPAPTHELDGFSRKLTWVGIALAASMVYCAYAHETILDPLFMRLDLPSIIWPLLRILVALIGAAGTLEGITSLIFWRSGNHWYRRLRF